MTSITMTEYWLDQMGTSCARPSYQRWVWRMCRRMKNRLTARNAMLIRLSLWSRPAFAAPGRTALYRMARKTRNQTESW